MEIINRQLATSCNFVMSKHSAKHKHDQLVNTTLELETFARFSRDRDKSRARDRDFYPCDRQDRITTTAHTTSAKPEASERRS